MPLTTATAALLFAALVVVRADGVASVDEVASRFDLEPDALSGLRVRQLREMLARKGATCDACVSKGDLVERIVEVKEWADVEVKEPEEKADHPAGKTEPGLSEDDLAKIREQVKGQKFQVMGKNGEMEDIDMTEFIARMKENDQKKEAAKETKDEGEEKGEKGEEKEENEEENGEKGGEEGGKDGDGAGEEKSEL